MSDWKAKQQELADALLISRLNDCQQELWTALATVDDEAQRKGMWGGSAWQGTRINLGKSELRKRADVIRAVWNRVIAGQSIARANELRATASVHAANRFRDELPRVAQSVIPKPGTNFGGMSPQLLDATADEIAAELKADLLLPVSAPESGWWRRQVEDLSGKVLAVAAGFAGAQLLPWLRSLLDWVLGQFYR